MQDDHGAEEDWDKIVPTDKALQYIDGWEPVLAEVVKATPNNRCTDWKLLWRNPQPRWISPKARSFSLETLRIPSCRHPVPVQQWSWKTRTL
jgi:hypothetical protein